MLSLVPHRSSSEELAGIAYYPTNSVKALKEVLPKGVSVFKIISCIILGDVR